MALSGCLTGNCSSSMFGPLRQTRPPSQVRDTSTRRGSCLPVTMWPSSVTTSQCLQQNKQREGFSSSAPFGISGLIPASWHPTCTLSSYRFSAKIKLTSRCHRYSWLIKPQIYFWFIFNDWFAFLTSHTGVLMIWTIKENAVILYMISLHTRVDRAASNISIENDI